MKIKTKSITSYNFSVNKSVRNENGELVDNSKTLSKLNRDKTNLLFNKTEDRKGNISNTLFTRTNKFASETIVFDNSNTIDSGVSTPNFEKFKSLANGIRYQENEIKPIEFFFEINEPIENKDNTKIKTKISFPIIKIKTQIESTSHLPNEKFYFEGKKENILPSINENSVRICNSTTLPIIMDENIQTIVVLDEKKLDFKKFQDIHSKNLNVIKKLNKRIEDFKEAANSNEQRRDTSISRLKRIQKFFILNTNKQIEEISKEVSYSPPLNSEDKIYYYCIVPGNNSELIKSCMKHRKNWKECYVSVQNISNFRWQQNIHGVDFSLMSKFSSNNQLFNHFEYHSQISNKLNLFINMMKYCESKGLDVFQYMPMTILIQYDSQNFLRQFQNFKDFFNDINDHLQPEEAIILGSQSPKKSRLKKYTDYFTFNFTTDKIGSKTPLYINPNHYSGSNLWLVKAIDLNRGRCIKIGNTLEKIEKIIKKFYNGMNLSFKEEKDKEDEETLNKEIKCEPSMPDSNTTKTVNTAKTGRSSNSPNKGVISSTYKSSTVIIQKYLENPLLYKGRKFDIRLWVLLNHKMEVYAFKEGHLKASCVPFDLSSIDSYIHLTNYSVQKYSNNFSKFEIGNEISFKEYQQFLESKYPKEIVDKHNINATLDDMCEIVKISMSSVKDKINVFDRKFGFEIFGYDFILDTDFKPYLLEVNTNPGLEESSPLIKSLLPRMIDDCLRLTLDNVFHTKYSIKTDYGIEVTNTADGYKSPYPLEGYTDSENLWKLVCELKDKEKLCVDHNINLNNKTLGNRKNKKIIKN